MRFGFKIDFERLSNILLPGSILNMKYWIVHQVETNIKHHFGHFTSLLNLLYSVVCNHIFHTWLRKRYWVTHAEYGYIQLVDMPMAYNLTTGKLNTTKHIGIWSLYRNVSAIYYMNVRAVSTGAMLKKDVAWASYQIRKIVGCACAGKAGNVFPANDLKRNHVLAITACITARASRTCPDACRDR